MKVWIFSKRFLMSFSDFRPKAWFSKLSTLRLHFGQMRFGKPSSSFNVKSDRALFLDASLSWLAFYQTVLVLLYGGYKPQRIHKDGKPVLFSLTGMFTTVFILILRMIQSNLLIVGKSIYKSCTTL